MKCRSHAATAFAIAIGTLAMAALGSGPADTRVTGTLTDPQGHARMNFTCFGMPICTGAASVTKTKDTCTNSFSYSATFTFSGVDLSRAGSFSGTVADSPSHTDFTQNSDGSC